MPYEIKLEIFEGPFDLLLSLIAKQKVDIYDIPIAKIADEYLECIKTMEELDLEVATEFLLVAATLLDLKAAAMLPSEEPLAIDEELVNPEEARENLIARLIEYRKFKSVAIALSTRYISESKYHARDAEVDEEFLASVAELVVDATAETLFHLASELFRRSPSILDASHIAPEPLRVDYFVGRIKERLGHFGKINFRELTRECANKAEIIASFLAILELYKRGEVEIGQAVTFGEIEIEPVAEVVAV